MYFRFRGQEQDHIAVPLTILSLQNTILLSSQSQDEAETLQGVSEAFISIFTDFRLPRTISSFGFVPVRISHIAA